MDIKIYDIVYVIDIQQEGLVIDYKNGNAAENPPLNMEVHNKKRNKATRWYYKVQLDDGSFIWRSKYGLRSK